MSTKTPYLVFQHMLSHISFRDVMSVVQSFGYVKGKKMIAKQGHMNCILSFEEENDARTALTILKKYEHLVRERLGDQTTVKLKSV